MNYISQPWNKLSEWFHHVFSNRTAAVCEHGGSDIKASEFILANCLIAGKMTCGASKLIHN